MLKNCIIKVIKSSKIYNKYYIYYIYTHLPKVSGHPQNLLIKHMKKAFFEITSDHQVSREFL